MDCPRRPTSLAFSSGPRIPCTDSLIVRGLLIYVATCIDQANDICSHNVDINRLLVERCNSDFVCGSWQPGIKLNRSYYGQPNSWQRQHRRQPGLDCRGRRRPHSRRSRHRRRRLVPHEAEREAESRRSSIHGGEPIRVAQAQTRLCGRDGQHRPDIRASWYGCATVSFGTAQVHCRLRRGPTQYLCS